MVLAEVMFQENQESSNNISAKVDSESIGRPSTPLANATAMSQLPPSGSKSKLKVSQKLEPQSSSGGIVHGKLEHRDRQIILKCLPTAALLTVVKAKTLHCRLHGLDEQSSVRLLSNASWACRGRQMKHKDGTTASIPRVPSGALEGIQPKLLREACLAKEKPPLLIMRVLGAMCLLLEENPTWLVARQLIVDSETNMTMAGEDADTASKISY